MTSGTHKTTPLPSSSEDSQQHQPTVAIHTHGCKLNQADSQKLARQFEEAGYRVVSPSAASDVVVLNTCTVTSTADAKARQFLRAARRRNPGAVVVATGCYAQRAPLELMGMEAVSLVVGNPGKEGLVESVNAAVQQAVPASHPVRPAAPSTAGRTRAMVKIQEGCDQVCAYCIVPKVRGRERSIPPEVIIAEIERRVAEGYREVTLTGTQLGGYGFDLTGIDLTGLVERVLTQTRVERLRVSSLQAQEINQGLLELWEDCRLMQHFHLPLQSGSDRILGRMRRRYDTAGFAASVEQVRRMYPTAGITTDIIVGFPGETAEDYVLGRDFATAMRLSDIHVFPYSPRPGTSAFYFEEQVAEQDKRERMGEMLVVSDRSRRRFREALMGEVRPVLWEQSTRAGYWTGLTDNYIRVRARWESDLGNQITDALLEGLDGERVAAAIVV